MGLYVGPQTFFTYLSKGLGFVVQGLGETMLMKTAQDRQGNFMENGRDMSCSLLHTIPESKTPQ